MLPCKNLHFFFFMLTSLLHLIYYYYCCHYYFNYNNYYLFFVLFGMTGAVHRGGGGRLRKSSSWGVHKGQLLSCFIKITASCVRSQLQEVDCKNSPLNIVIALCGK